VSAAAAAELPRARARGAAGVDLARDSWGGVPRARARGAAGVKLARNFGTGARPAYIGLMSRARRLVLLTL
jgi:hypothetical protein